MKKFISIMLCLMAALALCSCAKISPEEQYAEILKKYENNTAYDVNTDTAIEMTDGANEMTIKMSGNTKVAAKDADNMLTFMDISVDMGAAGGSMNMTMTYADKTMYLESMGTKVKSAMDAERAGKLMAQNTDFNLAGADVISNLKVEKDGDNRVFSFAMDPDKAAGTFESTMKQTGVEGMQTNITSAAGTLTVDKDNNILSQTIALDAELTMQGETVVMKSTTLNTFNAFGDDVKVSAPADAAEYIEVDPSAFDSMAA